MLKNLVKSAVEMLSFLLYSHWGSHFAATKDCRSHAHGVSLVTNADTQAGEA